MLGRASLIRTVRRLTNRLVNDSTPRHELSTWHTMVMARPGQESNARPEKSINTAVYRTGEKTTCGTWKNSCRNGGAFSRRQQEPTDDRRQKKHG